MILAAVLLVTAAGLVCLAIWRNRVSGPGLLFFFLLIAAAILGAAAVGILSGVIERARYEHLTNAAQLKAVEARSSPEIVKLEVFRDILIRLERADEETKRILLGDPLLAKVIAGNFGPVTGVSTAGGYVPYEFLDEWWAKNKDSSDLLPVTWWDVAGHKRQYASWLENHLIQVKLLEKWGGQRTARWAYPKAKADFVKYFYGERIRQLQVRTVEESEGET